LLMVVDSGLEVAGRGRRTGPAAQTNSSYTSGNHSIWK
jgi:hypothetical protein